MNVTKGFIFANIVVVFGLGFLIFNAFRTTDPTAAVLNGIMVGVVGTVAFLKYFRVFQIYLDEKREKENLR